MYSSPDTDYSKHVYKEPKIEIVNTPAAVRGKFATKHGQAIGTVHHFTAGHFAPDSKKAIDTLKGLYKNGYACFSMDEAGVIYVPKALGFFQKSWHAGKSKWKDKSSMNQWLYGIEVCNPGKATKVGDNWYASFNVKKGVLVKGAKPVDPARIRTWTVEQGKQHKGHYLAYTEEQVRALINWNLFMVRTNPDYNLDFAVGHDEISLSGKTDPGACMPMPMEKFRALLKSLAHQVAPAVHVSQS